MRTIDFRAWNYKAELMLDYGCIMQTAFNQLNQAEAHKLDGGFDPLAYRCLGEAGYKCMLCTGWRDRNGVKVYEGDVLEGGEVVCWDRTTGGFVFRTPGKPLSRPKGMKYDDRNITLLVVGNIFEDPHLIPDGERFVFYWQ